MLKRTVDELNDTSVDCMFAVQELRIMELEDVAAELSRTIETDRRIVNWFQERWDEGECRAVIPRKFAALPGTFRQAMAAYFDWIQSTKQNPT